jgi:hypothetical protein
MSIRRQISHAETFAAPAQQLFRLLSDWGGIVNWMPSGFIKALRLEGSGPGAIRHLTTGQGVELAERLDLLDEAGTRIALSLLPPLPWHLLAYSATGVIEPLGADTCRLTWTGAIEMPDDEPQAAKTSHLLRRSYETMFLGIRREVEGHGEH